MTPVAMESAPVQKDRLNENFSKHLDQPPLPQPPTFSSIAEARLHRKRQLAAAFRIFCHYGFNEGVAGHITVRDPEDPDTFWVNPFGKAYARMRVSDLIRVDSHGRLVDGTQPVNVSAFMIHNQIHAARPDVEASVHAHTVHGKAWSSLGRLLDPITQDACYFFEDHALFDDYGGIVYDEDEGSVIARAIGKCKALILQNHGLITVGKSIEEAAYWMIALDNACRAQLMAEAAGKPVLVPADSARAISQTLGQPYYGWLSFQALYDEVVFKQPDLLD
jgi:ribulose-5-phosphate 4-epimerase/fuculose-1-phosphate aldolase